jgi:hypothetical protein
MKYCYDDDDDDDDDGIDSFEFKFVRTVHV